MNNKDHTDHALVLGIWTLIFFWMGAKAGDLRGDPLVYAVIAKNMAIEGNWLNPMVLDQPYLNKPPLFFWIVGSFFKLFGVSYYIAKLPSLILSTLDIFLLYYLALRWFKDRDTAFFSAFSFMSTRWVIRDFASARPESLLVFGLLLGLFGFSLIREGRKSGPYLFGLGFTIMVMTKFTMVLFLLVPIFLFVLSRANIAGRLRWPHFLAGLLIGAVLPSIWIIYFERVHPGYFNRMLFTETLERAMRGLDVHNSPFLYLKEFLSYYHPWLIFFFIGLSVVWKRKKDDMAWFTILAVFPMATILQFSEGKMSRYLIPLTLFTSMIAAHGVGLFNNIAGYLKRIVYFLGPVLIIFFLVVPVNFNPRAYRTVHIAAELQLKKASYKKTLAFIDRERSDREAIPLVEWRHFGEDMDYEFTNYFYLPESRHIWNDAQLADFAKNGKEKIFLMAPTPFIKALPPEDTARWTRICYDETSTLFLVDHNVGRHPIARLDGVTGVQN